MLIVTVGFENNIKIQMLVSRILLVCCLVVAGTCFAKNCLVFSPNSSFKECSICVKNYYLVNCQCLPCPAITNNLKDCNPPFSDTASVSTTNVTAAIDTNSTTDNNSSSHLNNTTDNGTDGANRGSNGTSNGSINVTSNGNNESNSGITSGTANTTSNSNTSNYFSPIPINLSTSTTPPPSNPSPPSSNPTPSPSITPNNTPPSPSISDLAQIIFKLLPPYCTDFTLTPSLTCRACETNYQLNNNTCQPNPPTTLSPASNSPSPINTVPTDLKVTSSLPASAPLPIVINQPIPVPSPQPIFFPISKNTPNPSSPSSSLVVSSRPCPINPIFDPTQPVLGQNCPCLCFLRFYYDYTLQRCQPVNPMCKTVGCQNECLSCYIGYALINGKCLPPPFTTTASSLDPNCQTYQTDSNRCASCASRYYFSTTRGLCVAVDASCQTWDQSNGYCTSCFTGFSMGINEKICKPIPSSANPSPVDSTKCLKRVGGRCTSCAFRYFLSNGLCLQVSDQCFTFHLTFGYCTSCYGGYQLNDGICQPSLPNCAVPGPDGCTTCIPGYYSNAGECQPVSLLCNGYDPQTGYCLDCIFPYTLTPDGQCLYSP